MRRFVFAPRWVAGHVLVVVAVVSCLLLGRWQWHRSEATHALLNYSYALQWPLFAVFFAVMWWRMLRLESRRLDEDAAGQGPAAGQAVPDRPRVSPGGSPRPSVPPAPLPTEPVDDEDDEHLAAYNRMLAELAARDRRSDR